MMRAQRREACRKAFAEKVLPAFPKARERFDQRFEASCDLIEALPLVTDRGFRRYHPEARSTDAELRVWMLAVDVALTALGIKPLALLGIVFDERMGQSMEDPSFRKLLRDAGLETISKGERVTKVYDPRMAAHELGLILGRGVHPAEAKDAIGQMERQVGQGNYPHNLLGYPEQIDYGAGTGYGFMCGSRGLLADGSLYMSHLGFVGYDIALLRKHLLPLAYAMAIVELIRASDSAIRSHARITRRGRDDLEQIEMAPQGLLRQSRQFYP